MSSTKAVFALELYFVFIFHLVKCGTKKLRSLGKPSHFLVFLPLFLLLLMSNLLMFDSESWDCLAICVVSSVMPSLPAFLGFLAEDPPQSPVQKLSHLWHSRWSRGVDTVKRAFASCSSSLWGRKRAVASSLLHRWWNGGLFNSSTCLTRAHPTLQSGYGLRYTSGGWSHSVRASYFFKKKICIDETSVLEAQREICDLNKLDFRLCILYYLRA